MTPSDSDPSTDVPDVVSKALDTSSDSQLREIIHCAQQLLKEHPPLTEEVELHDDDEFVQLDVDLPDSVAIALETSSSDQLRAIIHEARQQLETHPTLTDTIESREDEELVRIEDKGAYSIVVVERQEKTGESRGPFAYMVQWEPEIDGEGKYRWHYLGRVFNEEET